MREKALKRIGVVDFGGQYAHLIARRIRELGIYSRIYSLDELIEAPPPTCVGYILSGGPDTVSPVDENVFKDFSSTVSVPVLGICYGHQLIASSLGGSMARGSSSEFGRVVVNTFTPNILFDDIPNRFHVWMSHRDHVVAIPERFMRTASSENVEIASYESGNGRFFGLQFHPEVSHTEYGDRILENFVRHCLALPRGHSLPRVWTSRLMYDRIIDDIRRRIGSDRLFLLVSGGVDSMVCLDLCIKAVGTDRVHAVHVDTGFMRHNEVQSVMSYMRDISFDSMHIVYAADDFYESLSGITDPEDKRKRIGKLFVDIVQREVGPMGLDSGWLLVQGTIYPDRIESGATKRAERIKTHHNRVPEIDALIRKNRVIEPLRDLYKHEVRDLGAFMGLPEKILNRHPFPGPGLAVRVICSSAEEDPGIDEHMQQSLREHISSFECDGMVLPIRSVGVQGDARTYHHPALIWDSSDDSRKDWSRYRACASRIVNRCETINRVILSTRSFMTGDLILRACSLTHEIVERLRRVDDIATRKIEGIADIWQMPVVSLPLFDSENRQAFVLRPVCSRDAMTADVYEMEWSLFQSIEYEIKTVDGAGYLFYDLTMKPPGTIEWE